MSEEQKINEETAVNSNEASVIITRSSSFRLYSGDRVSVNTRMRDMELSFISHTASPQEFSIDQERSVSSYKMSSEFIELCRVKFPRNEAVNLSLKILEEMAKSDELYLQPVEEAFNHILDCIRKAEEENNAD